MYSPMQLKHFDHCQNLSHSTLVDNLPSILRKGVLPADRCLHLHPFLPDHPLHSPSSRSKYPAVIVLKMESVFMCCDLTGGYNTTSGILNAVSL